MVGGLCRMLPVSPADPLPVEFVAGGEGSPDGVDFAALSGVFAPRKIADRGRREELIGDDDDDSDKRNTATLSSRCRAQPHKHKAPRSTLLDLDDVAPSLLDACTRCSLAPATTSQKRHKLWVLHPHEQWWKHADGP